MRFHHHQRLFYVAAERLALLAMGTSAAAAAAATTTCTCQDDPQPLISQAEHPLQLQLQSAATPSTLTATSPTTASSASWRMPLAPLADWTRRHPPRDGEHAIVYDFVVVGHGTVGRQAVQTLQQTCGPSAKIAVVEERPMDSPSATTTTTDFYGQHQVVALQAEQQHLLVEDIGFRSKHSPYDSPPSTFQVTSPFRRKFVLRYRHGLLLATGAHGAPIPHYLVDAQATRHIWQLDGQQLPLIEQQQQQPSVETKPTRPLDRRQRVLDIVAAGGRTCILGSGWEALDLLIQVASTRIRRRRTTKLPEDHDDSRFSVNKTDQQPHVLVMGTSGPLNCVLPTYLSAAVTKRLERRFPDRVELWNRSLIRYISLIEDNDRGHHPPLLHVYTAKSYDFLDSDRIDANAVIVAPDTSDERGSGTIRSLETSIRSTTPEEKGQQQQSPWCWYRPWSSIAMMPISQQQQPHPVSSRVLCYKDDGRIAVNSELCASSSVYAAGSVAKMGNAWTGHAQVAGTGVVDGPIAGHVAAMNMSRLYRLSHHRKGGTYSSYPLTLDSIPVWRSDLRSAPATSGRVKKTSLASVGIQALCVGCCDSERFSTQGVWWTNQSAHRRRLSLRRQERRKQKDQQQQLRRRRLTVLHQPVYGMGVVFYFDKSGKIQGVMTWGLPFTANVRKTNELNPDLVHEMKDIVRTNAGLRSSLSFSTPLMETEMERSIHRYNCLTAASKGLVATAFAGSTSSSSIAHNSPSQQLGLSTVTAKGDLYDSLPRPYHRYTENRRPSVRLHSVLKRNDGHANGILGEDLFARFEEQDMIGSTFISPTKASPLQAIKATEESVVKAPSAAAARAQAIQKWNVWEAQERLWDENEDRGRPAKEDPIWIRKGDEARGISARETIRKKYQEAFFGKG